MALDINDSHEEIKNKIQSFKTFKDSKSAIKKRLQSQSQEELSKLKDKLSFDAAALQGFAKTQVQGQIERLISMHTQSQSAGNATKSFLLSKFIKSFKRMKPKLLDIMIGCMLKSLGCDYEQTYDDNQTVYIKISSIDLFKILNKNPNKGKGLLYFEKKDFNSSSLSDTPRSTNRLLHYLIMDINNSLSSKYGSNYDGYSSQNLFNITYVNQRPAPGGQGLEFGDYFKVDLLPRTGGKNRVNDFFQDYYKTIDVVDFNNFLNQLLDIVFSSLFSVSVGTNTFTLTDRTKFGLFVQRILGQCFDNDEEISVSGTAKTPELDDTSDNFFEISYAEEIAIQAKVEEERQGIVTFADCNNSKFPVTDAAEYCYNLVERINETNIESIILESVPNSFVNDPKWTLSFPYPNSLKISILGKLLAEFPKAVIFSFLSPKVLLPFLTMLKALNSEFDDNINSMSDFMKKFRQFIQCLISKIAAIFIKILFDEIKKDLKNLARSIIADISKDSTSSIYLVIERLVSIALIVSSLIQDYRKCRSIIDGILALLNLVKFKRKQLIPSPLLFLSDFCPGMSPNRMFIEHINNLQKLGLPTGPLPDGSPNLSLMRDFSIMKSYFKEQVENGKIEGVWSAQPISPFGNFPPFVRITGKSL
jgi:hypothetical protein